MYRTGDRALLPLRRETSRSWAARTGRSRSAASAWSWSRSSNRLRRHPAGAGRRRAAARGPRRRPQAGRVRRGRPRRRRRRRPSSGRTRPRPCPSTWCPTTSWPWSASRATANGKLDRDALPWPVDAPAAEPAAAAGPTAAGLRDEIAALFADLLEVPSVDAGRDLWDQGATSFTMVQVSGELQRRHGRRLPVAALAAEPTVAGIAGQLATSLGAATPEPPRPEPAPEAPAATPAPVELFSPSEQADFKAAGWGRRPLGPDDRVIPLAGGRLPREHYSWLATRRDPRRARPRTTSLCRLLGLLRRAAVDGRDRFLYASAGGTYAVQTYVHVRPRGVEGLPDGLYHYRPDEPRPPGDRRAAGDSTGPSTFTTTGRSSTGPRSRCHLIGQMHGIEPLYGEDAERYPDAGGRRHGPAPDDRPGGLRGSGCARSGRWRSTGSAPGSGSTAATASSTRSRAARRSRPPAARRASGPPSPSPRVTSRRRPRSRSQGWRAATRARTTWTRSGATCANGRRSIGELPAHRRDGADAASPPPGGYLDDVDQFDSLLFHVAPRDASTLDPQLRLLLHVVCECLENAGQTAASLRRAAGPGRRLRGRDVARPPAGSGRTSGGGRGRPGSPRRRPRSRTASRTPSASTDPAWRSDASCSSSLAALHLAVESLRRGECGAAVVGAVNLVVHPYHVELLSGLDLLAAGARRARSTRKRRAGRPGEGAGARCCFRPAAAAARDRDVVHGVVEATGVGYAGNGGPVRRRARRRRARRLDRADAGGGLAHARADRLRGVRGGPARAWRTPPRSRPSGVCSARRGRAPPCRSAR